MNITDWISIGALIISILAFLYAYFTNTKKYELKFQYIKEIGDWHSKTVEVLIKMKLFLKNDSNVNKYELLSQLSSLIEIGRMYFPNINKNDNFGKEKPKAYQGYRNLILDYLVYSYNIFERSDFQNYTKHLDILQRHFTSHLYDIINPRENLKETKKYTKKDFTKELCFEDFISKDPDNIELMML
jgi:hypothetical protein